MSYMSNIFRNFADVMSWENTDIMTVGYDMMADSRLDVLCHKQKMASPVRRNHPCCLRFGFSVVQLFPHVIDCIQDVAFL